MSNKKTVSIQEKAQHVENATMMAIEAKAQSQDLLNSLANRICKLQDVEKTTENIQMEIAGDMFEFLSGDNHKLLGMSIKDVCEYLDLGNEATVRYYAKFGAVNDCMSGLELEDVTKLEAGKILSQGLTDDKKRIPLGDMRDNEVLQQRCRLFHDNLNAGEGEIKSAKMARDMVEAGIESLEDAQVIADEEGLSLADAVNPNKKSPVEVVQQQTKNLENALGKLNADELKIEVATIREMLKTVLKESK